MRLPFTEIYNTFDEQIKNYATPEDAISNVLVLRKNSFNVKIKGYNFSIPEWRLSAGLMNQFPLRFEKRDDAKKLMQEIKKVIKKGENNTKDDKMDSLAAADVMNKLRRKYKINRLIKPYNRGSFNDNCKEMKFIYNNQGSWVNGTMTFTIADCYTEIFNKLTKQKNYDDIILLMKLDMLGL